MGLTEKCQPLPFAKTGIMKRSIGIILIVLGLIGLIIGGIEYTTERKVLDIGPLEVTEEQKQRVPISPIVGAVLLLGGVILLAASRKAD
jgi:drug/metabolite transporter (DMT)-like permease